MKFCTGCGNRLDGGRFCTNCGRPFPDGRYGGRRSAQAGPDPSPALATTAAGVHPSSGTALPAVHR